MSGAAAESNHSADSNLPAHIPDGGGDGGDGGGESIDYGEILARQEQQISQQGQLVTSLRGELGKRDDEWKRIKRAFTGEQEEKLTPTQIRRQKFQALTQELEDSAKESLRLGRNGMPHTVKIGKELAQYAIDADERNEQLAKEVRELKERLDRQQTPEFAALERTAFLMEGMVEEALTALYGEGKDSAQIRSAQYDSVTRLINEELKDLIKNDREALRKVQRNPKVMRNMVNHFMKQILPPKVRELLETQALENEPDSPQGLLSSLSEAREKYEEALAKGDSKQADYWSNIMTRVRQDFLSAQYGGAKSGAGGERRSINNLISEFIGGKGR